MQVASFLLRVVGFRLRVADCGFCAAGFVLQVSGFVLRVAGFVLRVSCCYVPLRDGSDSLMAFLGLPFSFYELKELVNHRT